MMAEFDALQQVLGWVQSHWFGKYRGIVVDNADPTDRGRLKVRVPAVLDEIEVWAMPCVPYAGDGVGFYSLPDPKTGVWIEFEAGDQSFPIWTGCFWADGELPDSGGPPVKVWKTGKLTVRLDDDGDELRLETTSASTVTLASEVVTESGGATHTVGSATVTSDAGGLGKVEVTPASVSVNSGAFQVT